MPSKENLESVFSDVANVIRKKSKTQEKIKPIDFADKIDTLTGEGFPTEISQGFEDIGINSEEYFNSIIIPSMQEQIELSKQLQKDWNPEIVRKNGLELNTFMNSKYANMEYLPSLDLSNVKGWSTNISNSSRGLFNGITSIKVLPENFKLSKEIIDYTYLFYNCNSLLAIPWINTDNVTSMSSMFDTCTNLKSIPLLDTSSVTNMSYMFYYCSSLQSIPALDCSKVTNMSGMFYGCASLKEIHIKNINADLELCWGLIAQIPDGHCPLEHDALVEIISNLMPQENPQTPSKTLTIGETLKAKLSTEEIKVATDKGWAIK